MMSPPGAIEITLQPGEFYFGDASTRIRTLLGSCVSITMWHPSRLIGGMCHYMTPSRHKPSKQLDGRYADEAMTLFLHAAARHRTRPEEYQVKLFGGGNMFPGVLNNQGNADVAQRNVATAQTLITHHHMHLAAQDTGLSGHRVVIFDIWNGHVWVQHCPLNAGYGDVNDKNQSPVD